MPPTPLTDAEWSTLAPHLPLTGPGRPIPDPRARMDALFAAATARRPWSDAPNADTLTRHFRRWAAAGVWSRLLEKAAHPSAPKPLRNLLDRICALHRRTVRILGLPAIVLARRLNLPQALPGPSWLLPDPDLSETVLRAVRNFLQGPLTAEGIPFLRDCIRLLKVAGGRARLPRSLTA